MITVFEVTRQAHAEVAKRRKGARDEQDADTGGTPLHAADEGHREFEEQRKREEDEALKASRHPESGQFVSDPKHPYITEGHAADSPANGPATPRLDSAWPGMAAHVASDQGVRFNRVGDRVALSPTVAGTLTDRRGADHPERAMSPGVVQLAHLDLATASPFGPQTAPTQHPSRTAPINTGGN